VNRVEFAGQPLQELGVSGRPQHLDGDPLFPWVFELGATVVSLT
jgi:hypothetical protein